VAGGGGGGGGGGPPPPIISPHRSPVSKRAITNR
jgi:hypothetical protein